MASNLVPPNSTALERALAGLGDLIGAITIPVPDLQRPASCPIDVLPFLAWGLSVDRWDATWSEDRQRQAVANAVPDHKRRGSRGAMDALLASYLADYGADLTFTNWNEPGGSGDPFTFYVTLPTNQADASVTTASFATGLLADITRTKGARDLFEFRQQASASVSLPIAVAARAMVMLRQLTTLAQPDPADLLNLTTEDGEPLQGDDGQIWEYL